MKKMICKSEVELKPWVFEVSPNSALNRRDLAAMFNVGINTISTWINKDLFPKPDFTTPGFKYTNQMPSNEWYVKTIIAWFKTP